MFAEEGSTEAFVLVLGSKAGGKTSLINACLHPSKEDAPKPTIGLEYTFGRKPASSLSSAAASSMGLGGASSAPGGPIVQKEVAHVWELGGSSLAFSELISIVLTQQRLASNVLIYVVDVSTPYESLQKAGKWFANVRMKAAELVDRMNKAAAKAGSAGAGLSAEGPVQASQARMRLGYAQRSGAIVTLAESNTASQAPGEAAAPASEGSAINTITPGIAQQLLKRLPEHPDAKLIASTLLPFPSIVIGNKYDALKDVDSTQRKAVLGALRYLALCHGSHVLTTSSKDKSSLAIFRTLFAHCTFGTENRRVPVIDPNKPLYCPAGADSIESIGLPIGVPGAPASSSGDVETGPFEARLERFLAPVKQFFPPSGKAPDMEEDVDPSTMPPSPAAIAQGTPALFNDEASKHAEPVIDMLRVAKAEETARFVKEQERKLKLEAKAFATDK